MRRRCSTSRRPASRRAVARFSPARRAGNRHAVRWRAPARVDRHAGGAGCQQPPAGRADLRARHRPPDRDPQHDQGSRAPLSDRDAGGRALATCKVDGFRQVGPRRARGPREGVAGTGKTPRSFEALRDSWGRWACEHIAPRLKRGKPKRETQWQHVPARERAERLRKRGADLVLKEKAESLGAPLLIFGARHGVSTHHCITADLVDVVKMIHIF